MGQAKAAGTTVSIITAKNAKGVRSAFFGKEVGMLFDPKSELELMCYSHALAPNRTFCSRKTMQQEMYGTEICIS